MKLEPRKPCPLETRDEHRRLERADHIAQLAPGIMNALLSNSAPGFNCKGARGGDPISPKLIAEVSVEFAEALLDRIEEEKRKCYEK